MCTTHNTPTTEAMGPSKWSDRLEYGGLTLEGEEDGEGPLVDGEDAIEGSCQHKGGHEHLARVEAQHRCRCAGARSGALVRGAELGGDHPLLGLLQVQHACADRPRSPSGILTWLQAGQNCVS